jgi:hypothetical protein
VTDSARSGLLPIPQGRLSSWFVRLRVKSGQFVTSGQDGTGLRFETLEHGGEYSETMPQAIRVSTTPKAGPASITVDGKVVDSKGFTLEPAPADAAKEEQRGFV